MNESLEVHDYSSLESEMEALRRRIEDLEAGRARPKAADRTAWWRRLAARPALAIPAVTVAVLAALSALVAQTRQDSLYIDDKGNVGINQSSPQAPLDVNGNALVRGDLNLGNSALYFTNVDHASAATALQGGIAAIENSKDQAALALYGRPTPTRRRVVSISDRLGVGTSFPNEALDVAGTIRGSAFLSLGDGLFVNAPGGDTAHITKNAYLDDKGNWQIKDATKKAFTIEIRDSGKVEFYGTQTNGKADWRRMATFDAPNNVVEFPSGAPIRGAVWTSDEYVWDQGKPKVEMTKSDHSTCFITYIRGYFAGWGEWVEITKNAQGRWVLGGNSGQKDVRVKARCIGAPDNAW